MAKIRTIGLVLALFAGWLTIASPASAVDVRATLGPVSSAVVAAHNPRTLVVKVTGLKGKRGRILVTGHGVRKSIGRSTTLRGLKPGTYRVVARPASLGKVKAYPAKKKQRVKVTRKSGARLKVAYTVHVSNKTAVVPPSKIKDVRRKDGRYTIKTTAPLQKGDVLASGVGPQTPTGLLVKVTSVEGNQVVGEQARLEEAIPEGQFSVAFAANLSEDPQASASSRISAAGPTKPYSCDAQARAGLEAGVYGELPVSFSAGWGGGDPYVSVRADVRAGAYAKAWAEGSVSCTITERFVWGRPLTVITVWVGPVPIVFVPRIDTYVGAGFTATGKASAEASLGVTAFAELTAHTDRLDTRTQEPVFNNSFNYGGSVELNGHAYARLRVTVDVYGVAGPNVNVTLQPEVSASTARNPWWTAGLRVMAGGGIKIDKCVKVLFVGEKCVKLAKEKTDVLNKYVELAHASGGPTTPTDDVAPGEPVTLFDDYMTADAANPAPAGITYPAGPLGPVGGSTPLWVLTTSKPTYLNLDVADDFLVGDNYEVVVDGRSLGRTSEMPIDGDYYSTGTFRVKLPAGTHTIRIWDVVLSYLESDSPFGGGYIDSGYSPAGFSVAISVQGDASASLSEVDSAFAASSGTPSGPNSH